MNIRILLTLTATIVLLFSGLANAADKVGILWEGRSKAADTFAADLTKFLKEKVPAIEVEVAGNILSVTLATAKYEEWQTSKSAIVFLRTSGSQIMAKMPPKIPGFVGLCSNPAFAGCMTDPAKPDKNITGVTYYNNAAKPLDIFLRLVPAAKTVGLIADPSNPSHAIELREAQVWAKSKGITLKTIYGANNGELVKGTRDAMESVDFFVLGYQSSVAQTAPILVKVSSKPLFSFHPDALSNKGAICGLVSDNTKQAATLADSIVAVVLGKKTVAELPVKFDDAPDFVCNDEIAAKFNLTIPAELKAKKK